MFNNFNLHLGLINQVSTNGNYNRISKQQPLIGAKTPLTNVFNHETST